MVESVSFVLNVAKSNVRVEMLDVVGLINPYCSDNYKEDNKRVVFFCSRANGRI